MTTKAAASAEKNSTVITLRSPEHRPLAGAYSRPLRRGVLGDIDGRSREGRFLTAVQADLVQHIGGSPTIAQTLLIRRIARTMLSLEILDLKLASGNWNECDARTQGGLNNNVRLSLRELGLKGPTASRPRLADALSGGSHRHG
jgi:hypothetical protein